MTGEWNANEWMVNEMLWSISLLQAVWAFIWKKCHINKFVGDALSFFFWQADVMHFLVWPKKGQFQLHTILHVWINVTYVVNPTDKSKTKIKAKILIIW